MISSPAAAPVRGQRGRGRSTLPLHLVVILAVSLSTLFFVGGPSSAQDTACGPGQVLSENGVTCELDVGQNAQPGADPCPPGQELDAIGFCVEAAPDPTQTCPPGQRLDAIGLSCEDIPADSVGGCPPGTQPDELQIACVPIPTSEGGEGCEQGFSLGADGVTCVADPPSCKGNEIINDDGECQRTWQCPDGYLLKPSLTSCYSDGCPEDEVESIDGRRCLAKSEECPDGSPRPVGGSCLIVETVEVNGTTEVVVRCSDDDLFCQAQVKACADSRAGGDQGEGSCEDPRTSCADGDSDCAEANDRLVECFSRDRTGEAPDTSRQANPCEDLCPALHRLDPSGACIEYLDPRHPCVSFGQIPEGVTTNRELDGYSFLAGTGQCVTRTEFLRRLGNFEAAAGAEQDALALLRATTSEYLTVEEQLAGLETSLASAEADVASFTAAAADADLRRAQNEKTLLETQKVLQRERRLLELEVLDVYVTGGTEQATEAALLGAQDLNAVGIVQTYSEAVLDDQIDNIARVENLEVQAARIGIELDEAAAEVQASLASAVVATQDLESLLADTARIRAEQLERRDQEAQLVSELREDKGRFAQELGIFDQASREIADIISESEFLVSEFEDFDGIFAKPVIPARVVSGFGPRLHPILGYVRNHQGLDFDANFGEPIYASAPGIVQIASSFGGYGETVVLDHGNGLLTLYAHMSVIGAEVGDEIQRGDVIGFIGSTGLSTGPHLHFEVWIDGRNAVDPMLYFTDLD